MERALGASQLGPAQCVRFLDPAACGHVGNYGGLFHLSPAIRARDRILLFHGPYAGEAVAVAHFRGNPRPRCVYRQSSAAIPRCTTRLLLHEHRARRRCREGISFARSGTAAGDDGGCRVVRPGYTGDTVGYQHKKAHGRREAFSCGLLHSFRRLWRAVHQVSVVRYRTLPCTTGDHWIDHVVEPRPEKEVAELEESSDSANLRPEVD